MIFDNLIDAQIGKPVEMDFSESKDLERTKDIARESGERFRKIWAAEALDKKPTQ